MRTLIVELVGLTGSGKSTVSGLLAGKFNHVGPLTSIYIPVSKPIVFLRIALVIAHQKGAWFWADAGLIRRLRRLYALEKSLMALSKLGSGVSIIDEGPLHSLMTFRIRSENEARFWKSCASQTVKRIAESDASLIVARIRVDSEVRFERCRKRRAQQDRNGLVYRVGNAKELEDALSAARPFGFIDSHVENLIREQMMGRVRFIDIENNSGSPKLDELIELIDEVRGGTRG